MSKHQELADQFSAEADRLGVEIPPFARSKHFWFVSEQIARRIPSSRKAHARNRAILDGFQFRYGLDAMDFARAASVAVWPPWYSTGHAEARQRPEEERVAGFVQSLQPVA